MHRDEPQVIDRIERMLTERIRPAMHRVVGRLSASAWTAPGEPVAWRDAVEQEYRPVAPGTKWGRAWATQWFRLDGEIPQEAAGAELRLLVDIGFHEDWPGNQCEGMLLDEQLVPLKAINSMNRTTVIRRDAVAGEPLRFYVEAAANPDIMKDGMVPTPYGDRLTAPGELIYEYRAADLVIRDDAVWHLFHDVDVLRDLMLQLPEDSTRRAVILRALEDAMDALDHRDIPGTAGAARAVLAPALAAPAASSAQRIATVGHAHIDSAWLWPVRETIRKVSRTFSNVVALMDEYPDFRFTATSAQQYAWLQSTHPEIFARVAEKVRAGQWAVSGGMWVESDVNMPGAEALVRQFTTGIRWFRDELGVRPRCLWLPDSFGYPAALPQIALRAGMTAFLTQKLSWNQVNDLPHSSMWWEGIDGSRIFTHFPPVDCYDSELNGEEIARAERNFSEKGRTPHQLIPFGYGDGGGGPIATMVERQRRRRDLEGSPRLEMDDPEAFFARAEADYGHRAPTHRGELYLELHRGIFTSQLEMKQGNRRVEHALRTAELVWTLAALDGATYPFASLDAIWKRMLLLQFHDILPGTSIAWVHREARADYAEMLQELDELIARGLAAAAGDRGDAVVNVSPHARREALEIDGTVSLVAIEGSAVAGLPGCIVEPEHPVAVRQQGAGVELDNGRVRVGIDADGAVTSIRDLIEDRELLVDGTVGNLLEAHPDFPNSWDAWDIDRHYLHDSRELSGGRLRLVESGPVRASVEIEHALGASRIVQRISLTADARQVDFAVEADWKERETLLKVGFPLAVEAREHAAEIQFGHVRRPVHENTSWEHAKFEVPAHRWVLVDEPGYGVAVANDSTYGHDVRRWHRDGRTGTLLRLSLLRSPQFPDPDAGVGSYRMRYSLVLGADPARAAAAGYALNLPLRRAQAAGRPSLVSVADPDVHVEAVMMAADGSGDVIVRLYEGRGGRARTELALGFRAARVIEVDLLDDAVEHPSVDLEPGQLRAGAAGNGHAVPLALSPFQILSLRITPEMSA